MSMGEKIALFFSALGGLPCSILVVCGFVGALLVMRRQRSALAFSLAVLFGALAFEVLKEIFRRPRPVEALIHEVGYSFPSGHATMALAIYGAALFLFWPLLSSRLLRAAAALGAFLLVVAIGASRIILQVHYPGDVLGGYVLGFLVIPLGSVVAKNSSLKDAPRVDHRIEAAVLSLGALAVAILLAFLSSSHLSS